MEQPRTHAFHLDYLLVVLHSFLVIGEEQFDALAIEHLVSHGAVNCLPRLKEVILDGGHAHRFTVRGRAFWARVRHAGHIDSLAVVWAHDVAALVEAVARESSRG